MNVATESPDSGEHHRFRVSVATSWRLARMARTDADKQESETAK